MTDESPERVNEDDSAHDLDELAEELMTIDDDQLEDEDE